MGYEEKDFGKLLKKNALTMRRLVLQEGTECMRVYDRNLESFPVSVDLYGKYARITDYSLDGLDEETVEKCCDIVRRMCYIQVDDVVFHRRSKIGKEQHEILSEQSLLVEVKESGHTFTVDLTKRIDTGLFLDHMRTRQMVERLSRELRVLNLFSYTGAFSVYAAKGGAKSVDSVDLSSTYTNWAKENLLKNGFEGEKYNCIAQDALKFIIEAVKESCKYDLIIFDPPSFSNSRKMQDKFDVSKDYLRYFNLLNNLLEENGILIFSTNLSSFHMDSGRVKGFEVTQITKDVTAPGFTKAKGTSRTWLLKWTKHVRLLKRDFEGFSTIQNAKESDRKKNQMDKEKIMENLEENKVEVVETITNNEQISKENTIEDAVKETVVTEEVKDTKIIEDAVKETTVVEETSGTEVIEENTNDYEKIIADLEEDSEPSNEDDMLSLNWDDSEVVAPTVRTKSKPKAVTSLADRKNNNRDEEVSDSRDSDRRDSRGERGDNRRSSGRDNDRGARSSYGRDNDRGARSSYGRDNDRGARSSYGRDNDRGARSSYGRDNDRGARSSYGRDNDRGARSSYSRDNDRGARSSYGRDNDRGARSSYGRDNDRDSRSSYGRDNDRGARSSYGRDNDRGARSSYGRDNDRGARSSYSRDNDRGARSSYGRDNDRGARSSYGRDNDRGARSSYGRDNDRGARSSYGRDNDRGTRSSYGRDNDRSPRSSFGGRDGGDRDSRRFFGGRDGGDRDSRRSFGGRDGGDRDSRRSFGGRDNDRSPRSSFGGRDGGDRDSRRSFGGRDNDRSPRSSFGGRDGGDRDSRRSFGGRDNDRSPRSSFGGRDGGDRDSRRSFGGRDGGDRDSRRSFGGRDGGDRDSRKSFGGRDSDRRGFRGDDKRTSSSNGGARRSGNGPKPYGFDNVKTTRTRGEGESTGFFWLAGNDKKDK